MKLSDFDYYLPKELIAHEPLKNRDCSRLMVLKGNKIFHKKFYNIIDYLKKDDILVINETKVIAAKLTGKKETGGKVEIIVYSFKKNIAECLVKGKRIKINLILFFKKDINSTVIDKKNNLFVLKFNKNIKNIMKLIGEMPTPPYVKKKLKKKSRYQTIYSKKLGSIASPTAGLHFTKRLLKKIEKKGVKIAKICLHVSYSTFYPIKTENIKEHKMEPESFEIKKEDAEIINNRKGNLFIVGTTTMKTLETAADSNGKIKPIKGFSELFIYPGYNFKTKVKGFITNFHLPKSTLILLVSTFYGKDKILNAYKEAIKRKYRFYSFGDAMLLLKENKHPQ